MQYVPSGPERDRRLARARDTVNPERDEPPPAPVLGLAAPELAPARLMSWETVNEASTVTLGYGSSFVAGGPFVEVRTSTLPVQDEPSLQVLLAGERERLAESTDIDEPEPSQVDTGIAELDVDGTWLAAPMRREDQVWAARVEVEVQGETARVSVVARGVDASRMRLAPVSDLAPLWRARAEWIAQAGDREAGVPEPVLPEAVGLEGHEALVAMVLAQPEPRSARRRKRRLPPEWKAQWDVAIRAQMRFARQSEAEAYEAVSQMVNHLSALAAQAAWWPQHGAAAVAETIRYIVFDSDVPSRSAQLHYAELTVSSQPQRRELRRGWLVARDPARERWLASWEAWASHRG